MKLELTNHGVLKTCFESISSIVDEITLIADKDGIHLRSLDQSHITFITMELEKTLFDTYECNEPEKINIDCSDFTKMLKKCKNNETLKIDIEEDNIIMSMIGDGTRRFKIALIDLAYENQVPPKMTLPCKIKIPSNLLKQYITDMADFDEKLTFIIDENYFKIRATGQIGTGETEYIHGENILETVESHFSIPKLQNILKASKFSQTATLELGDDMPLKLTLELVTGDGYLQYLLAPRLEED